MHYKWSHPWSDLNGLKKTDSSYEFVTRLCWKSELQTISYASGRLERRNYERKCREIETLILEYESRKHSGAFNGNGLENGLELVPLKYKDQCQSSSQNTQSV